MTIEVSAFARAVGGARPSPESPRGGAVPVRPPAVLAHRRRGRRQHAPADIQDVSATGIGLRVRQALKPGTVLVLTLQTRDHHLSRPLPVRVIHATALADGEWLAGCQFIRPLNGQDLRALVGDE